MILPEKEVQARLESPLNLMNRLREITKQKSDSNSLSPCLPPTADKLIEDLDDKLKTRGMKVKAAAIMSDILDSLKSQVNDLKPEKLAYIAQTMNGIINSDAAARETHETGKPSIVIYAPQINQENHYEQLTVPE